MTEKQMKRPVNLYNEARRLRDIANAAQRLADNADRAALAARAEADEGADWTYEARRDHFFPKLG